MNLCAFKNRKHLISAFILMMMVAAFALKAIIPVGFMPEAKGGFMEMVICSGMGEKTVFVPNSDIPLSENQNDTKAKDVCAYQVLASGKILIPSPVVALLILPSEKLSTYISNDNFVTFVNQLSFDARGPPSV